MQTILKNAMELALKIERDHLGPISVLMVSNPEEITDSMCKDSLKASAQPFSELFKLDKEFETLVKAAKKAPTF